MTNGACTPIDIFPNEVSGLSASGLSSEVFWVHNDDGDPIVFALNIKGEVLARVTLQGATNLDWEDNAIGPGPVAGKPYLYQADIGMNSKKAGEAYVYRLLEPTVDPTKRGVQSVATDVTKIVLRYPVNAVLNFETMLVDPILGDLFIIQKGGHMGFKAEKAQLDAVKSGGVIEMKQVISAGDWISTPSAGAISPLGHEIVIRDEETAWFFKRAPGQSVEDALRTVALKMPLGKESNGEAITFGKDGKDIFTATESLNTPEPISIYRRLP
jgi:hypothetical protein